MSDLMLDVGQANELKLTFRRHDFTSEEVKRLSEGDFLGQVRDVLRGVRCITEPELLYPDWVEERLTPNLEVTRPEDPSEVELRLHPSQDTDTLPKGERVYEHLTEEHLLKRSLSYGHLKWLEANLEHIPADWRERKLLVFGWASVVRSSGGRRYVPFLLCGDAQPCVRWFWLGFRWDAHYPEALRK